MNLNIFLKYNFKSKPIVLLITIKLVIIDVVSPIKVDVVAPQKGYNPILLNKCINGTCKISFTTIPIIILKNTFLNLFSDCAIEIEVVNIHLNNATKILKQNTFGPQLLAP